MELPDGPYGTPYFGPSVFDTARRCPAKAAVALMGRRPAPAEDPDDPTAAIRHARLDGGGWIAVHTLLRSLAHAGPTSTWAQGTHPSDDLAALARDTIPDLDPAVRDFATTTLANLLEAQAASGSVMDFQYGFVSRDFRGGKVHAGGVFLFTAANGAQAWRVTFGGERPREDRQAWALTAAFALTDHLARTHTPETIIEVLEMSAAAGQVTMLGAWRLDETTTAFATLQPRLTEMAHDARVTPGSHCAGCAFVGACPAVPHATDLLPGVPRQEHVTTITATDLKAHGTCPARHQILSVHTLPRIDAGASAAMERGRSLDEWLTSMHSRDGASPCAATDPLPAAEPGPHVRTLSEQHMNVCPLSEPDAQDLLTQPTHVVLDVGTQLLLVARPDATYSVGGEVVWRETKTRAAVRARDPYELVQADLSAAIYLLVLHAAAGTAATLEWEELDTCGAEVTVLPCDDNDLVTFARNTAAGAIADLVRDDTHAPRPGPWCEHCAAAHWCPAKPGWTGASTRA